MALCTCATPRPNERSECDTCHGFACTYASRGRAKCPEWRCDCFIETYPDSPMALHPEAFQVGEAVRDGDQ